MAWSGATDFPQLGHWREGTVKGPKFWDGVTPKSNLLTRNLAI